jgi:hypothetical protein
VQSKTDFSLHKIIGGLAVLLGVIILVLWLTSPKPPNIPSPSPVVVSQPVIDDLCKQMILQGDRYTYALNQVANLLTQLVQLQKTLGEGSPTEQIYAAGQIPEVMNRLNSLTPTLKAEQDAYFNLREKIRAKYGF